MGTRLTFSPVRVILYALAIAVRVALELAEPDTPTQSSSKRNSWKLRDVHEISRDSENNLTVAAIVVAPRTHPHRCACVGVQSYRLADRVIHVGAIEALLVCHQVMQHLRAVDGSLYRHLVDSFVRAQKS